MLTGADGLLDQQRVAALAEELHQVIASGRKVALVSSGAVGAGMGRLGMQTPPERPGAACKPSPRSGKAIWSKPTIAVCAPHGRHAAQVLLTADDLDDRTRYLNVRNTILTLFELGAVPIINENDTVSVEELQTTFGDNDRLAAMVTNLIRAPLLGAAFRRRRPVRRRSGRSGFESHSDGHEARRIDPGPWCAIGRPA